MAVKSKKGRGEVFLEAPRIQSKPKHDDKATACLKDEIQPKWKRN